MYRLASVIAVFAALIHAALVYMGKFNDQISPFIVFIAVYVYLAFFLFAKKRSAAWLAFVTGLVGMVSTVMSSGGSHEIAQLFQAATIVNGIAAASAFVILWGARDSANK